MNGFITSAYAGLFWFQEDFSSIVHNEGEVEFHTSDIVRRNSVLPIGTHRSFSVEGPYSLPRGRVEVEGGKVIISIGEACPETAIELVIKAYGLARFRDVLVVKKNKFWDKRIGEK